MIKDSDSRRKPWSRQQWIAVGILLLGFMLVVTSLSYNSVTVDEPVHALTGYSILKTGDLRLVEDHPPLLEIIAGFPLVFDPSLPDPRNLNGWVLHERRTFANDAEWMLPPIDRWLIPARIPITFFLIILCAVTFRWTADLVGYSAGLLSCTFIACDPNCLAHSGLATLDVGVTALCFSALFLLYRLHKKGNYKTVMCAGVVLGLALSSKISALPLLPIACIWMLLHYIRGNWSKSDGLKYSSLYFLIAMVTVWACHLFQVETTSKIPWIIPAPTYWHSLMRVSTHLVTENRFSYLLGRTYRGGDWTYFPWTFVLKTPEGPLALLLLAVPFLAKIWQVHKLDLLVLALYPLFYLTVSLSGAINLGYRHLLPVIPYLYLLLSLTFAHQFKRMWLRYLIYTALFWQIAISLFAWPYYIPYFNSLVGGTSNGYKYLADSNVDWGQGLKAVKRYLEEQGIEQPFISAFTPFVDPSISYDIEAKLLPPQRGALVPLVLPQRYNPMPGDYILSASTLRGLQVADPDMFNWFWHRQPKAVIAGAMLHYIVSEPANQRSWVAQCVQPVSPLSDAVIFERFGIPEIRIVPFDCTRSWVYPAGEPESGWYVLHAELDKSDAFITSMMEYANLIYYQDMPRDTPRHAVYTMAEAAFTPSLPVNIYPADSATDLKEITSEGADISLPLNVGDILAMVGVETKEQADNIELWVEWEVRNRIPFPVSLMGHAISENNQVIAVDDGLGIPFDLLLPGDIFVQRHRLNISNAQPGDLWLQTGLYRLDTLERYPILDGSEILGDQICIPLLDKE